MAQQQLPHTGRRSWEKKDFVHQIPKPDNSRGLQEDPLSDDVYHLGTSPKVTMDGRLYNQLCLLSSPTKLVEGLLTGPYAEDC